MISSLAPQANLHTIWWGAEKNNLFPVWFFEQIFSWNVLDFFKITMYDVDFSVSFGASREEIIHLPPWIMKASKF